MADLRKLATLKQMLVEGTDFFDVYGYFMDHFGGTPELLTLGEPFRDATFVEVLEQLGARVVGERARISQPFFLRVAEHGLVHGAFVLGAHVGSVFYFEGIEKGLAGFGTMDSEGPTELARFTLARLPGGKRSLLN